MKKKKKKKKVKGNTNHKLPHELSEVCLKREGEDMHKRRPREKEREKEKEIIKNK